MEAFFEIVSYFNVRAPCSSRLANKLAGNALFALCEKSTKIRILPKQMYPGSDALTTIVLELVTDTVSDPPSGRAIEVIDPSPPGI